MFPRNLLRLGSTGRSLRLPNPISGGRWRRLRASTRGCALEPGRGLQLVEPVVAHFLDDAVADHDQSRTGVRGGEMLVNGERRNVDEIAAFPFELLGLGIP